MKSITKNNLWLRRAMQIFFFVLIALIVINHNLSDSAGFKIPLIADASLHAVCPFGGVVSLYQFATTGSFVQKIHQSSFVLMVLVFILAILFGPVFCGWVCPLGSIQEWVVKIGKRIHKRKYNHFIPVKFDRYLRYTRYLVLIWVLYMTATSGKLIFQEIDPYFALFNFWSSEVAIGAVLGITNLFRIFSIRRVDSNCKNCKICSHDCPMNIDVHAKDVVRDHQCISCLECSSEAICPVDQTVIFAIVGGK